MVIKAVKIAPDAAAAAVLSQVKADTVMEIVNL